MRLRDLTAGAFYPPSSIVGMPTCTSCGKERTDAEMTEGGERGGC